MNKDQNDGLIVFLYTDIMDYTTASIEGLLAMYTDTHIHIIAYNANKIFLSKSLENKVTLYEYNESSLFEIQTILSSKSVKFLYVAGWSNKKYKRLSFIAKDKNIPTIVGCDTVWISSVRQIIATIFSKFLLHRYFKYIIIPGLPQYKYARLLGFSDNQILKPMYSCNTFLFHRMYGNSIDFKQIKYPRKILFVGRLEYVKGIDILLEVFNKESKNLDWELSIVGDGSLRSLVVKYEKLNNRIKYWGQLTQNDLGSLCSSHGLFCLPSRKEPWGVVVHEFSAAGFPLLLSSSVNSAQVFLKNGLNGQIFKTDDKESLRDTLLNICNKTDNELLKMSELSYELSKEITPKDYALAFNKFMK